MSKFDFNRIAQLLHIEEKTREQPTLKAIRDAVIKELNDLANPPQPEAPKKAPAPEPEPSRRTSEVERKV